MDSTTRHGWKPLPLLDGLLLAVIVFGLTVFSLVVTRTPGMPAVLWLGNGVLVGWLLTRTNAYWPATLAIGIGAEVLARAVVGHGLLPEARWAACNLIEVVIVAGSVRRRIPDLADPRGWPKVGVVATAATLLACAVSGLLMTGLHWGNGGKNWTSVLLVWYFVHVVGMVLVATLVTVLRNGGLSRTRLPRFRRLDFAMTMGLLALVSVGVFAQRSYPLLFLTYPPLLLGAFRHRLPGVVIGVSLLSVIALTATLLGNGPLAMSPLQHFSAVEQVVLVHLFIGGACLMMFPVGLAVTERQRLMVRMRDSEARYRMLADHSSDLVMRVDPDGTRAYVSPSAREILGRDPADLLGSHLDTVHPDDRAERQRIFDAVAASGELAVLSYRVCHARGHYVWLEAIVRPLPGVAPGESQGLIVAARDVSARVAAEQELAASRDALEKLVRIDGLTGLANRRQLDERLGLAITRSRRHGQPVALIYLDIDYFKQINDSLGHAAGDAVLQEFARRLTSNVRAGDLVARLGGDEFVILIEDAALPTAAEVIARKLITAMVAPIDAEGTPVATTTSIGIGYARRAMDAQSLMACADTALYAAKHAGRNTYCMASVDTPHPLSDAPPERRAD